MFEFRGKKPDAKPVLVKYNNKIVRNLIKIQQKTCQKQEETLIPIELLKEVKHFIKGYYPKIIGLVLLIPPSIPPALFEFLLNLFLDQEISS